MKRKIIKLGNSTLVTSLPSKWIKKYNLKQGAEVDVEERGKEIIISTKKELETEKKELDLNKLGSLFNYGIAGIYISGADELKVNSQTPRLIEGLQEHPLNQLIGYEIVEQQKNTCTIKDVSGTAELDFKTIIRRIFLIINSVSEEILTAMEKGDTKLGHIRSVDTNANRFTFLSLRKLNKQGHENYKQTPVMYSLTLTLERIGDSYRDLAEYITEKKVRFSKETIEIFKKVNMLYRDYQSVFFKFNIEKAAEIDQRYRNLRKEFDKLLSKITSRTETRAAIYIFNIADYVAEMLRNQLTISL